MILYDSTNIKVLELPDSVRKRPGMYFGDVKNTGANTVVNELLANSIDQFLAGKLTHIKILIKESVIQFSDDGPGLPFNQTSPDNANNTLVEHYLTKRHDSATADLHAPHVHVVTGGLGLAVLNAVSETIIIDSSDGKTLWHQEFGKGRILSSLSKEKSKKPSGTTFKLKLDNKIFGKNAFDMPQLRKTVFELAHFYPGLTLEFQDERFHSKEGLLDLANFFYKKPSNSLSLTKQFSFTGKSENVQVHLAAIGDSSNETEYFSWVNGRGNSCQRYRK